MVQNADFKFVFDKRDKIYRPGEAVTCRVVVRLREAFSAHTLTLRFSGKLRVGKGKSEETVELFKHEEPISILRSSDDDVRLLEVSENYTYQATYQLPLKIPASYEHPFGNIRYSVKARFDPINVSSSVDFFVECKNKLPLMQNVGDPLHDSRETTFSFCCWRCRCYESDTLKITHILPRTVWQPGDTLPFTVEIQNYSDVGVKSLKMRITEELSFSSLKNFSQPRVVKKTLFTKDIKIGVAPMQKKLFKECFFLAPDFDFKHFHNCKHFVCRYYVESIITVNGIFREDLRHRSQFIVGMVRDRLGDDDENAPRPESRQSHTNPEEDLRYFERP
ncbi:arrestin domain-containing protein 17-like [Culicoides brevitarsis]|uniref:arrestin domain-containing protein 17-like n=1 Tax=Culicoides brevitarsis TaxID=469753 RepID=UPI00307B3D49